MWRNVENFARNCDENFDDKTLGFGAELLQEGRLAHANELQMGKAIALEAKPITRNAVIT